VKRRQIAICDREPEYARRFAEYANQRQEALFLVHGFSDCEALLKYAKEHAIDILLLAEEFAEEVVKKENFGQIFLLAEEGTAGRIEEYPVIPKLESCDNILRRVLDIYAEEGAAGGGRVPRMERMKRIGIYSPVGRSGKTSFALALGQALSRQKRTLYLNLEEYSGFAALYPYGDEWTLSELMYFLKQGKQAFAWKLESRIRKIGGLDYIPPLKSPVELRDIRLADWENLFEALERESRYEILLLDLGGAVNGLYEILEQCDGVYTPAGQDESACAKMQQYEQTLKMLEMEEVLQKTTCFCIQKEELDTWIRQEEKRWLAE